MQWLLDPVMLDSALQIQVLWARLQWEVTLLPAEIAPRQSATLCVSAVHAGYLHVVGIGDVSPTRTTCRTVRPAESTTYVVQAVNKAGSTTRTITLTVRTLLNPVRERPLPSTPRE